MSDLIDPASGDWDELLARQMFWEMDAQRILAKTLPLHEMRDFLAWNCMKSGTLQCAQPIMLYGNPSLATSYRIRKDLLPKVIHVTQFGAYGVQLRFFLSGGRYIA